MALGLAAVLTQDRGVAVVEFAILAPILLFFAIAGLEFSRSMKYTEVATMLSREAASIAYRVCSGEVDPQTSDRCLQKVREDIEGFGDNVFPGTTVLLSLFRFDGDSETCSGRIDRLAFVGGERHASKVKFVDRQLLLGQQYGENYNTPRDWHSAEVSRELVCKHRAVVVSEVHIPFESILGIAHWFFSFTHDPEEFYDFAIM